MGFRGSEIKVLLDGVEIAQPNSLDFNTTPTVTFAASKLGQEVELRASTEVKALDSLILSEPTLVGYWPLDDAVGSLVFEDVESTVDLTIRGTPSLQQPGGVVSQPEKSSVFFDGATDSGVDDDEGVGNLLAAFGLGNAAFSIECMVFPTLIDGANVRWIVQISTGTFGANAIGIRMRANGALEVLRAGGQLISTILLSPNTWQHLVFTYDGATMRIFKNGRLVDSVAQATAQVDVRQILIGSGFKGTGFRDRFRGRIQNVAVYSGALTADDVLTRYQAGVQSDHRVSNVRSVTTAYTIIGDGDEVIFANGTFAVTLPPAATVGGRKYTVKATGGMVTVTPTGVEAIDGTASRTIPLLQGEFTTLHSDGVGWRIISANRSFNGRTRIVPLVHVGQTVDGLPEFRDAVTDFIRLLAHIPDDYNGGDITVKVLRRASVATNTAVMRRDTNRVRAAAAVLNIETATNIDFTPGTVNDVLLTWTIAAANVAIGDGFRIDFSRVGADAGDTLAGTVEIDAAWIEYTSKN